MITNRPARSIYMFLRRCTPRRVYRKSPRRHSRTVARAGKTLRFRDHDEVKGRTKERSPATNFSPLRLAPRVSLLRKVFRAI